MILLVSNTITVMLSSCTWVDQCDPPECLFIMIDRKLTYQDTNWNCQVFLNNIIFTRKKINVNTTQR